MRPTTYFSAACAVCLVGCATSSTAPQLQPGAGQIAIQSASLFADNLRASVHSSRSSALIDTGKPSAVGYDGDRHFMLFPYRVLKMTRTSPPGEKVVLRDEYQTGVFLAISADRGKSWKIHDIGLGGEEALRRFIPSYSGSPSIPKYKCCETK